MVDIFIYLIKYGEILTWTMEIFCMKIYYEIKPFKFNFNTFPNRCHLLEYTFFSLKIINSKNIDKNILEISDQNCINIEVTLLYFSTNQLKTQNKNIQENSTQKLINRKTFRLQNK